MDKILNFVLTVVKRTLLEKDYKQVGRLPRFFNAKEQKEIEQYNLLVWPGYDCTVKCLNDGIFLNVDTATKFVSMTNILERIQEMQKDKFSKEEIRNALIPKNPNDKRLVVITMYNTRIYQIDDLRWDITPKT